MIRQPLTFFAFHLCKRLRSLFRNNLNSKNHFKDAPSVLFVNGNLIYMACQSVLTRLKKDVKSWIFIFFKVPGPRLYKTGSMLLQETPIGMSHGPCSLYLTCGLGIKLSTWVWLVSMSASWCWQMATNTNWKIKCLAELPKMAFFGKTQN